MVHLWIVHSEMSAESGPLGRQGSVSHVQSLEGHSAPITCLEFSESASWLQGWVGQDLGLEGMDCAHSGRINDYMKLRLLVP